MEDVMELITRKGEEPDVIFRWNDRGRVSICVRGCPDLVTEGKDFNEAAALLFVQFFNLNVLETDIPKPLGDDIPAFTVWRERDKAETLAKADVLKQEEPTLVGVGQ